MNAADREICDCPVCGCAHWKLGNPPKELFATEEQAQRGLNDIWPGDKIDAPAIPPANSRDVTIATLKAALVAARDMLEVVGDELDQPLHRSLEVGFRHSPLSTKEQLTRFAEICSVATEEVRCVCIQIAAALKGEKV